MLSVEMKGSIEVSRGHELRAMRHVYLTLLPVHAGNKQNTGLSLSAVLT